jgi:hypothetical protein
LCERRTLDQLTRASDSEFDARNALMHEILGSDDAFNVGVRVVRNDRWSRSSEMRDATDALHWCMFERDGVHENILRLSLSALRAERQSGGGRD